MEKVTSMEPAEITEALKEIKTLKNISCEEAQTLSHMIEPLKQSDDPKLVQEVISTIDYLSKFEEGLDKHTVSSHSTEKHEETESILKDSLKSNFSNASEEELPPFSSNHSTEDNNITDQNLNLKDRVFAIWQNYFPKLFHFFKSNLEKAIPMLLANLILLLVISFWLAQKHNLPQFEYRVIYFGDGGEGRLGADAIKYRKITPATYELDALGSSGWELVSTYLETETSYPNFGDNNYVTGIQPNIRPQRLVCIFRRVKIK
ncbi:MAG TPA: hypothetical protein PLK28_16190 [Candidatus Rifleibacterium sp.]|nr:hypothetical protein [Candidatus Rifleibacterium sp.]